MPLTSVATDNFEGHTVGNRLDAHADWAVRTGTDFIVRTGKVIEVDTDAPAGFTATASVWVGAGTFNDDQYSQFVVSATGGGGTYGGVVARWSAGDDGYWFVGNATDSNCYLERVDNGTGTTLGSANVGAWALSDEIRIECEGTTIRGVLNNVTEISVTSGTYTSGSVGVGGLGDGASFPRYDSWEGGNITAAGGTVHTLSANAAGTSSASSADNAVYGVTASAAGAGAVTLREASVRGVTATAAGAASATLSMYSVRSVGPVGDPAGVGTATVAISAVYGVTATAAGAGTATVAITKVTEGATTYSLAAAAGGAGAVTLNLARLAVRDTQADGVGTAAVSMALCRAVSLEAGGAATASAALSVVRTFSVLAAGSALASADIERSAAASTTARRGKYAAQHAQAYRMVAAAAAKGFAAEHARALRLVRDAGA